MSQITPDILQALTDEHSRSLQLHPPKHWEKMTPAKMLETVIDELWEIQDAIQRNDATGPHGIIPESIQAANVCLRMAAEMKRRQQQ